MLNHPAPLEQVLRSSRAQQWRVVPPWRSVGSPPPTNQADGESLQPERRCEVSCFKVSSCRFLAEINLMVLRKETKASLKSRTSAENSSECLNKRCSTSATWDVEHVDSNSDLRLSRTRIRTCLLLCDRSKERVHALEGKVHGLRSRQLLRPRSGFTPHKAQVETPKPLNVATTVTPNTPIPGHEISSGKLHKTHPTASENVSEIRPGMRAISRSAEKLTLAQQWVRSATRCFGAGTLCPLKSHTATCQELKCWSLKACNVEGLGKAQHSETPAESM